MTVRDDQRSLTLTVPADRTMSVILRLMARGATTLADLPMDEIEALELAVSEAAALLLPLASAGGELTMHIRFAQRVWISMTIDAVDPSVVLDQDDLPWHTLRQLDPHATTARDLMTVSVEFSRG